MARQPRRKPAKSIGTRATVTFPPDLYGTLERIAQSKKVSIAWVVRDAAERYVADQWPLLEKPGAERHQ